MFLSRPEKILSLVEGEDIVVSFRVGGDPKPRGKGSECRVLKIEFLFRSNLDEGFERYYQQLQIFEGNLR